MEVLQRQKCVGALDHASRPRKSSCDDTHVLLAQPTSAESETHFPAPPFSASQLSQRKQSQVDPPRVEAAAAPAYKQLIFGHEVPDHTHWDERRQSPLRLKVLQAIFRLLRKHVQLQQQHQKNADDQQWAEEHADATHCHGLSQVDALKVAQYAANLEEQVYRLHESPRKYPELLRDRRMLWETIVHVNAVQDKVDLLRRLLKRFAHHMQCSGCSRRECREFRTLGDHIVRCPSVQALVALGQREPCDYACQVPSNSAQHQADGNAPQQSLKFGRSQIARQCSHASAFSGSLESKTCTELGESNSRHCDILKWVLFHNVNCSRPKCRVCSDLGSVLPTSLMTAHGEGAHIPSGSACWNLRAYRSACRLQAAAQRRRHILSRVSENEAPASSRLAGASRLAPRKLAQGRPKNQLPMIVEVPSSSSCPAAEANHDLEHDLEPTDSRWPEPTGVPCNHSSTKYLSSSGKIVSGPTKSVSGPPSNSSTGYSLRPRPFLSELHSRCTRKD